MTPHEHHAIDYIELSVTDISDAKRFYGRAFGWTFEDYGPDYAGIAGRDKEMGGLRVVDEVAPGGPLVVLFSEDLEETLDAVRNAGGRIAKEPFEFPGGRRFEFVDPAGNELAVWSPIKGHSTVTAARHVLTILAVTDLDLSTQFYRTAFGWPARVEVPVFVEFELPDGRGLGVYERKSFAVNTEHLPSQVGAGEITGTEIYLHCDDLDAAIERLHEAGARQLSARAERPWGDEAAYFADPDGNVLVVARPLG